ncbi:glycosyltransferase family 2 protein [Microbacterium esteraromaticum]|uniref:Glycosyltransferase family 2 protein n=1 Tax=Microbacterium esteraromaticum TaxID=57043 RepID=A0A939DUV1_9MICO|nr:glycosyltransferase family 2 protein [Microbacterium esteraromaticum]MBN8415474.1 glycosyltransferase family 2 protein [Microbacterium esteraromaticum]
MAGGGSPMVDGGLGVEEEDGDLVNERSAVVVVATYKRPDHVRTCLEHIRQQTRKPQRIVVVDASPDILTEAVVAEFPEVDYRRNDLGIGTLAASRAIGVQGATEDVIAFIDDDAYAEPQWLAEILRAFDAPGVGAVGGRADNNRPEEEREGWDRIGRFLPNGTLTGNFGADPGRIVETDHMLGANMSVSSNALRAIGGIHDYYPGTCLREDSDLALRVKLAGYRVVFAPRAVVLHVAGEYAKGKRFDLRYRFYAARNHVLLLTTVLGWRDPHLLRHIARVLRMAIREVWEGVTGTVAKPTVRAKVRRLGGGMARAGADLVGTCVGLGASLKPNDRAYSASSEWKAS